MMEATSSVDLTVLEKVLNARFPFKTNVKFIKEEKKKKRKERLGFHPKFKYK